MCSQDRPRGVRDYDRARDSLINLIKPRRNRRSTRSERRARHVRRNRLGGRNTATNSSPRRSKKARYISRRQEITKKIVETSTLRISSPFRTLIQFTLERLIRNSCLIYKYFSFRFFSFFF
ncbi:hypothetical protein PUN28_004055 [Cardiocondyla obscurior]|uniref:Uncharacterized protein n=1 Tax=Cardiocondyla obscurior TaxID=286306 RepID=A0AAW2GNA9_9HYME